MGANQHSLCEATETCLIRFGAHVCFVTEFVFGTNEWQIRLRGMPAVNFMGVWTLRADFPRFFLFLI